MYKNLLTHTFVYLGITLLVIASVVSWFWIGVESNEPIGLTKMGIAAPVNFLAISPMKREGHTGMLFIRLSDGAEQFIAGDWEVNFTQQGNVYAFGYFPEGYSQQIGQQVYRIQPDGVVDITVNGIDGRITSIHENAQGTYALIEVSEDTGRQYCLVNRSNEDTPECTQLNIPDGGSAQWSAGADHEVAIKNGIGQILLYDPENPGFREVSPEESDQFSALSDMFDDFGSESTAQAQDVYTFGNRAVFRHAEKWQVVEIPWFSLVALLADQKHLLAVSNGMLMVIDIEDGTSSQILPTETFEGATIQFYDDKKFEAVSMTGI